MKLVLLRHGASSYNEQGLWTGLTDIELSEKGREESRQCAELISDIPFDYVFTSALKRSTQTWDEINNVLKVQVRQKSDKALNERDYGDYTGKNKWELKDKLGEEEFLKIRRSWNYPIPSGETLKDVYKRVIPFYQQEIEPLLKDGRNILIVAHGNSLRALIKFLENISDNEISKVELATGEVYVYTMDREGNILGKEIRGHRENLA